jgi:carbon-monoxide dehydrogenase medium subunit
VIPSTFSYQRAGSVEEAVSLASEHGDDAKFLAGGHSLLPLMKLRLAAPEVIIDLGGLHDLSYVNDQGSYVAIGALTRHHDVEHSDVLAREVPLLAHAAGQVGDPQIRHRGTIGGSIAHADPASDLPAVLLALDATLVARGPGGSREIPIGEFFQSLFETALEPDELLTEIRVPKSASAGSWSFQKFTQRAIDWAIVGCAVQDGRVALVNMGGTPLRAAATEAALAPRPPTRPRTPPRAPTPPTTSAPPRPTASTWPASWSPAPSPRHVQGHDPERAVARALAPPQPAWA